MSTNEHNMKNSLGENIPELTGEYQVSVGQKASEEQVAHYMSSLLDSRAQHVSTATAERLSNARNLAVTQLAIQQAQAANYQVIHQSGNVLHWLGDNAGKYFGQHRLMSAAMLAGVMLLTFFAVQQIEFNHNLENSDAFLLASDLPPEAYADKGFNTWLVSKRD